MFEGVDLTQIALLTAVLIIAVVGHEIAHGWVAYKFGDLTAKNLGRLSVNPIKHIDPLGTIVIPAALYMTTGLIFGWAKPVPINVRTVVYNGGYKAAILVTLAGIIYNLIIATIAFGLLGTLKDIAPNEILIQFLFMLMIINLILALFNLYPIPPLDGSKALEYLFRLLNLHKIANMFSDFQRYGMIIILILVLSPLKDYFFYPIRYVVQSVKFLL